MKRYVLWICVALLLIPSVALAANVGLYQRDACTSITSPVAGKTFCLDQTAQTLKVWNGSAWVPTTTTDEQTETNALAYQTGGTGTNDNPYTLDWTGLLAVGANTIIRYPVGTFALPATGITISADFQHHVGAGKRATIFKFTPVANNQVAVTANAGGGNSLWHASLTGVSIRSDEATLTKTAIDLVDVRTFTLRDVEVSGTVLAGSTSYWSGVNSIGLQTRGRESISVQNVTVHADRPLVIADNPNSTIDIDHTHFLDCELIANGNPVVEINSGVNLTHVTFDGRQAWVSGTYGLKWVDTATSVISIALRVENVRWEQSESPAGYVFDIEHNYNLHQLYIKNSYGSINANGIKLRKVISVELDNVYYIDPAGEALNVNGTVYPLSIRNCYWQVGSTVSLVGLSPLLNFPQIYSTSPNLPSTGYYEKAAASDFALQIVSAGWFQGESTSITQDATATIGVSQMVGMLFIVDDEAGSAQFVLNGPTGSPVEVADISSTYTVTKDSASSYNVYTEGTNYVVQNKRTGSHKVRWFFIGAGANGF